MGGKDDYGGRRKTYQNKDMERGLKQECDTSIKQPIFEVPTKYMGQRRKNKVKPKKRALTTKRGETEEGGKCLSIPLTEDHVYFLITRKIISRRNFILRAAQSI